MFVYFSWKSSLGGAYDTTTILVVLPVVLANHFTPSQLGGIICVYLGFEDVRQRWWLVDHSVADTHTYTHTNTTNNDLSRWIILSNAKVVSWCDFTGLLLYFDVLYRNDECNEFFQATDFYTRKQFVNLFQEMPLQGVLNRLYKIFGCVLRLIHSVIHVI